MVRLVVAEDSYLVREGLRLLLETQDDLDLVAAVTHLPGLLAAVDEHRPDVVVTDIRMPPTDRDEGIQAAEHLADEHPDVGVVVLSQHVRPEYALRVFDARARGRAYLMKERVGDVRELRRAIQEVHAGGTVLDPQVVDALVAGRRARDTSPLDRLTPREAQVLAHVAEGASNATIAERLVVTERAVQKHIGSIFAKLELHPDDTSVDRRVRAVLLHLADAG